MKVIDLVSVLNGIAAHGGADQEVWMSIDAEGNAAHPLEDVQCDVVDTRRHQILSEDAGYGTGVVLLWPEHP